MIAMASFDFLGSSDKEQGDQRQICFCFPACQKIDPVSQATRRHTEDGTHWLQAISFTQHGWVGCFSLPNCIVIFIVLLHSCILVCFFFRRNEDLFRFAAHQVRACGRTCDVSVFLDSFCWSLSGRMEPAPSDRGPATGTAWNKASIPICLESTRPCWPWFCPGSYASSEADVQLEDVK